MRRSLFLLLTGTALLLVDACGSISSQGNDGGGGTGAGSGQAGAGGSASGGSSGHTGGGGQAGDRPSGGSGGGGQTGGGGQGGGVACGPVTCSAGMICCNSACGICAPPGAACVQGCPVGGQGGGAAGATGQGGASGKGGSGQGGGATGAGGRGGSGQGGASGKGGSGQGGGTTGAAGHGNGGQGGQTVDAGVTCAELTSDYAAAMPAARACTPGATSQCQALVPTTLSYCTGCSSYVNDATKLEAIRAQWTSQGCSIPVLCPAIACIAPGPSSCVATDSGPPGGVCSTAVATTN